MSFDKKIVGQRTHKYKIFYKTGDNILRYIKTKERNQIEAIRKVEALQLSDVPHTIINIIEEE